MIVGDTVVIRVPVRRYTPLAGNVSQAILLIFYISDLEQDHSMAENAFC